ncbi:MAG: NAD-dependent epimerase/dehydratase family protein [Pseudonocardiaceae bacterium]
MTAPSVAATGAGGFLGWHTRVRARAQGAGEVTSIQLGPHADADAVADAVCRADRLLHLAGVNRGTPHEIRESNTALARQLAAALRRADTPPATIVYANSTQASNGTNYGTSKMEAAEVLATTADEIGVEFVDLCLPNLFGEHGRPFYNSVVATFAHQLAHGGQPRIEVDRELPLLHVQDAAELLLTAKPGHSADANVDRRTITSLRSTLSHFAALYRVGEIPELLNSFDIALFNTYRSFTFPDMWPIPLIRRADQRGSFVETVRAHGSPGQFSYSTTRPGIVRGQHFHLAKVERFAVISGQAEIALRRVLTDETVRFQVSGAEPVIVDMPTMWVHNLTNTGDDSLVTLFWTNELFDPASPDTYPEDV